MGDCCAGGASGANGAAVMDDCCAGGGGGRPWVTTALVVLVVLCFRHGSLLFAGGGRPWVATALVVLVVPVVLSWITAVLVEVTQPGGDLALIWSPWGSGPHLVPLHLPRKHVSQVRRRGAAWITNCIAHSGILERS
eukprot:gene11525-34238_t